MDRTQKPEPDGGLSEEFFSLKEFLRIVRRRAFSIVLAVVACLQVAFLLSIYQTPRYEASIKILVGQQEAGVRGGELGGYVSGLQQLSLTMSEAVESRPLAEAVIEELNLQITPEQFLEEHLNAEQIPDTQFIQVQYSASDPETAQQAANALGEVFSEEIAELSPDMEGITATVWEPAALPEDPLYPDLLRYVFLALVIGSILGLGIAFLREYLDDGWHSSRESEAVLGLPVIGEIPAYKPPKQKKGRK